MIEVMYKEKAIRHELAIRQLHFSLLYAVDENNVMGKDNRMPWYSPQDFEWFKSMTLGSAIVMGRKTWDSLPKKPLPDRQNFVLSRDKNLVLEGATVVHSLAEVIPLVHQPLPGEHTTGSIFVIGGKEVLEEASRVASIAYVTTIGVKTPIDKTCVMGPNIPPIISGGVPMTLYEGCDKYPSAVVVAGYF